MKSLPAICLLFVLMLSGVSAAQVADDPSISKTPVQNFPGVIRKQNRSEEDLAKLRFAASQHEIISILLDEQDFEGIVPEYNRILELELTGDDESLVVKEALIIADRLMKLEQYPLAHEIIDETLEVTRQRDNRFSLLMMKGKIYKEEGQIRKALKTYKAAQRIQK